MDQDCSGATFPENCLPEQSSCAMVPQNPDDKSKFKNIRSPEMLKPIVEILNKNNFYINNLDINLICEKPKVSKYRNKILKSLSHLLALDKKLMNLKGKTVEKLGLIGKEKAIACEVIVSIYKYD